MGANKLAAEDDTSDTKDKGKVKKRRALTRVTTLHCDLIRDEFWKGRPYVLLE